MIRQPTLILIWEKPMRRSILCAAAALVLTACGGGNTESSVQAPGAEETAKTKALETGAAVMQDRPPIDAVNAYLDGFHSCRAAI